MGEVIPITREDEDAPRLRAVIYLRVSTLEQASTDYGDDGYSLQAQGEACRRTADRLGADVVDEYVDRGKSARSADRPQLQAMLRRLSGDRDVDLVIVHKIDRLARNRADDVQIVLAIKKAGASLISASENIDETPSGTLLHAIMAGVAEFYSANLGLEAKKGMKKKAELGGTPGNAPVGYINQRDRNDGKDIGVVVGDPDRAHHIRWAFSEFAKGDHSLASLCHELTGRGFTLRATARYPERPIHPSALQQVLRNRYYLGVVKFQGVEYPGRHETLVDPVTFEAVQTILSSRKRGGDKPQKRNHPLKAVLRCGHCNRRMGIMHSRSRLGELYPYFYCLGRQQDISSCPQGLVRLERVEHALLRHLTTLAVDDLRAVLARSAVSEWYLAWSGNAKDEVRAQRSRIEQLKRRQQKAKEAYFADAIGIEDLKAENQQIARELAQANDLVRRHAATLAQLEAGTEAAILLLTNPAGFYRTGSETVQRLLLQELFDALWIRDQELVGGDLTKPYRELLGLEAAAAAQTAVRDSSAGQVTFHRSGSSDGLHHMETYLRVERPFGPLKRDREHHRARQLASGSNFEGLVGLRGLEPLTSSLSGKRSNRLSYRPASPSATPRRPRGDTTRAARGWRNRLGEVVYVMRSEQTGAPSV